ncbi:hypothetical protein JNM05_00625 [bacterium]|nr:hypothetical protein [bacterium]
MKNVITLFIAIVALTFISKNAFAQEDRLGLSEKPHALVLHNRIGFAAGNVSGVGISYERNISRNFSTLFVIGGVAQKSNSDFNTGLSLKYAFSRITNRIAVYTVVGGSYFYDRKINGIYDETTGSYSLDRVRKYLKLGAGLGIEALFFDGRLGVDLNFIGIGASYQKREHDDAFGFGDKPIRGPQVNLTYHF